MTTYTSQPDDTTGYDTYINSGLPTTNSGTATVFVIGNDGSSIRRILIKFDLSSIPAGATVSSATLYLYIFADFANQASTWSVYRQLRAWTETGATWNKYDGTNDWGTAGGMGAADCEASNIGTASVTATQAVGSEIAISLTASKIQEMINGTFTNNGFLIRASEVNSDTYQVDSSGSSTSAERPKLVIEYSTGGGQIIWWS